MRPRADGGAASGRRRRGRRRCAESAPCREIFDSGRRGIELLKKQPDAIDLIVLDLTMPEPSREHTLGELRVVRNDIPVVITSGFQAEDASTLLEMPNVVGFLDKPHTMTSLEMSIAAVAQRTPNGTAQAGTTASSMAS